ncbi:hypothetical protein Q0M94_11900 [Deinococcus radiomollis]|uniref:hypothetical protein n=1 Tax=Deinococcus radiomollis TaxID=468916 RepID=UPI003892B18F
MTPTFPHVLSMVTPYGTVDLAGFEIPPEGAARTEERPTELLTLLDGRSLPRRAARSGLQRLKFSSPQGHAIPGDRAAILKQLLLGDAVTISENLTNRDVITTWTNAIVFGAPPQLIRQATDIRTGTEYYSFALEFVATELT